MTDVPVLLTLTACVMEFESATACYPVTRRTPVVAVDADCRRFFVEAPADRFFVAVVGVVVKSLLCSVFFFSLALSRLYKSQHAHK